MGDINPDFNRNTKYASRLVTYLGDININKSWDSFPIDYTHEFENNNKTYICTIDHFFWNEKLKKKVKDADVLHLHEHTSDHCPIYCTIDYDCLDNQMQRNNLTTAAKVNWKCVTPHQKNALNKIIEERLLKIHIHNCITECRNVHCRNKDHVEAIDLHMCTLLGCINDSVKDCLPQTGGRNKKSIPGWNDEVKPFRFGMKISWQTHKQHSS